MYLSEEHKGIIAIVVASILWGTTGTVASFAPNINPLAIGGFAMGMAGVLMLIKTRKKLRAEWISLINCRRYILVGGLSVAIYPLAFYSSMRLSGVAVGTVISIASAPIFAVVLERLIGKVKVTRQWVVSFIVGALGISLLTLGKAQTNTTEINDTYTAIGIMLGLVAGVSFACYAWVAKQLINRGLSSSVAMSSVFGSAAIILLPSLIFTGSNLFSSLMNTTVSLYMALIPMFLGYILFGYGLNVAETSRATLITLLEPIVATIFAIFVVGEQFSAIGWLGMLLVCFCLMAQIQSRQQVPS